MRRFFGIRIGILVAFFTGAGIFVNADEGYRQLPLSSIEAMRILPKSEFDARYPGTIHATRDELPEGWYVTYRHESLGYFFGPARFRSTAESSAETLKEIVEAAKQVRAEIEGYTIEAAYLPRPVRETEADESSPRERSESDASGPPPPPPSWLDRLLGIFRRN